MGMRFGFASTTGRAWGLVFGWLLVAGAAQAQLQAAKIFNANYKGVVKLLMFDPVLEQKLVAKGQPKGSGFLSRGSGFVISDDGYIFTNRHVVETCVKGFLILDVKDESTGETGTTMVTYQPNLENDPSITDIYYAGYTYPVVQVYNSPDNPDDYTLYLAEVVTLSNTFDGAILKIVSDLNGKPVTTKFTKVALGNSDQLSIGQDLMVLGFPAQYNSGGIAEMLKDHFTLTVGRHSGIDYVFDADWGFVKTDAQIHPGNSGGPVFNAEGQVIGIASAKGVKTNIGLVGRINAMTAVANPSTGARTVVAQQALKPQARPGRAETILGTQKYTLPSVERWYADRSAASGATVTGTVKSSDTGKLLAGVTVGLLTQQNGEYVIVARAVSDASGAFAMSPAVKNGTYYFAAVAEGYEDVIAEVNVVKDQNDKFTVTLARKN